MTIGDSDLKVQNANEILIRFRNTLIDLFLISISVFHYFSYFFSNLFFVVVEMDGHFRMVRMQCGWKCGWIVRVSR